MDVFDKKSQTEMAKGYAQVILKQRKTSYQQSYQITAPNHFRKKKHNDFEILPNTHNICKDNKKE